MSKLYIVGIGPGSAEYLTFRAQKVTSSVEVLIGSKRALKLFPEIRAEKIILDSKNMENSFKQAIGEVKRGRSVALLSTGDPGFSGVLKPVLYLSESIEVEVVPGISSIQLCAAKLLIPWDEANLITLHGKGDSSKLLELLDNGKPTMVLPNFNVNETAKYLLNNGVDSHRKVAVCEKLSYTHERIVEMTLSDVLGEDFSYMCVMFIF